MGIAEIMDNWDDIEELFKFDDDDSYNDKYKVKNW